MHLWGLNRLYSLLLRLYPPHFQAEFADEMEDVFEEAVAEAASRGWLALTQTFLAELTSLPGEALRQYLRRPDSSHRTGWEGPPSGKETLVALGIFGLPAVGILLNSAPDGSTGIMLACVGALLLTAFLAGLVMGFPRWSLPYLGLALSGISFTLVFQQAADLLTPSLLSRLGIIPQDKSTALLLQAMWAGMMWLSLFALTFLVIGLLSLLRRFRPLIDRIRQDWTLASFILYSGTVFTLLLAFDRYGIQESTTVTGTLCLATGAWLYLRSPRRWQRALALLAGLTLAMWTAIASQWSDTLILDWGAWLHGQPMISDRWTTAYQGIFEWGWMALAILAPALLKLFPQPGKRTLPP